MLYRHPATFLRCDALAPILTSSSKLACRISSRHGTTMRPGGRFEKRGSSDAYTRPPLMLHGYSESTRPPSAGSSRGRQPHPSKEYQACQIMLTELCQIILKVTT